MQWFYYRMHLIYFYERSMHLARYVVIVEVRL